MRTYRWLALSTAVALTTLEIFLFTRAGAATDVEVKAEAATPSTALTARDVHPVNRGAVPADGTP